MSLYVAEQVTGWFGTVLWCVHLLLLGRDGFLSSIDHFLLQAAELTSTLTLMLDRMQVHPTRTASMDELSTKDDGGAVRRAMVRGQTRTISLSQLVLPMLTTKLLFQQRVLGIVRYLPRYLRHH